VDIDWQPLIKAAREAIKNSYAPYSHYRVASSILGESGKIYTGVNVENASYGLTVCAERTAIFRAISEGERKFKALFVLADGNNKPVPCGACLQVIKEFANSIPIACGTLGSEEIFLSNLNELLPYPFEFKKG